MRNILLCLFPLLCCCSEQDNDAPPTEPVRSESNFGLTIYAEEKVYELGEPCPAELTIEERYAAGDGCLLTVELISGKASVMLDDTIIDTGTSREIPYDIINESASSKTLRFVVTPLADSNVSQTIRVRFTVRSADGIAVASEDLVVKSVNSSPIIASAIYSKELLEPAQKLRIDFEVHKEGYDGNFLLSFVHTAGQGYCEHARYWQINDGDVAALLAPFTLEYTPTAFDDHELTFTISDGMLSTAVEVSCKVPNEGGLSNPDNGIYIYADGKYYPSSRWDVSAGIQAEGIAVLTERTRFLIGFESYGRYAIHPKDDIAAIPNLTITTTEEEALDDFAGLKNTEAIVRAYDAGTLQIEFPIAYKCYNHDKAHPGRWYLPASGQMGEIAKNIEEVMACLDILGRSDLLDADYDYASSTGYRMVEANRPDRYYFWGLVHNSYHHIFRPTEILTYRSDLRGFPVRDL